MAEVIQHSRLFNDLHLTHPFAYTHNKHILLGGPRVVNLSKKIKSLCVRISSIRTMSLYTMVSILIPTILKIVELFYLSPLSVLVLNHDRKLFLCGVGQCKNSLEFSKHTYTSLCIKCVFRLKFTNTIHWYLSQPLEIVFSTYNIYLIH